MFVCVPLLVMAALLMADTNSDRAVTLYSGDVVPGKISPWRFFSWKFSRSGGTDVFMVRLLRGKEEWHVQFENVAKGYSFSRYCAAPSLSELHRTLRLLQDDAKYGFTLPF